MSQIRVIICGAGGYMGREVQRVVEQSSDFVVAALVDRLGGPGVYETLESYEGEADVLIDFSNHQAIDSIMKYCEAKKLASVIATTGHTAEELDRISLAAEQVPVFQAANMSLGVALLYRLVGQVTKVFPGSDVEIIEKHHNRKIDAPSGTALFLAEAVKAERQGAKSVFGRQGICPREPEEIGIHALRMGNVVGEHEVIFSTGTQTISLKHEAHDRALFAEGAIAAARFIVGKLPGRYGMEQLLED